jgi:hypothetical protein
LRVAAADHEPEQIGVKKKLLRKRGLLIAAWRVMAGFLAKESSSGNN